MDFLKSIDEVDFASLDIKTQDEVWVALRHLRKREWRSRIWVIQEALFAKSLEFHCGEKSISREPFTRLHEIEACSRRKEKRGQYDELMAMTLAGPFDVILMDWDEYKENLSQDGIRLPRLLTVTTDCRCTEPRDKIFALLGMSSKVDQQIIEIDYQVSLCSLMIKLCKYELIEREIFSPLFVLQTTRSDKKPELPSWIPCFTSCEDDSRLLVPRIEGKMPYQAAADNKAWTSVGMAPLEPIMIDYFNSIKVLVEDEGSFETLVLDGLIFDVVQVAFRTPWVDIYEGCDPRQDRANKQLREENTVHACMEWESIFSVFPQEVTPTALHVVDMKPTGVLG
ncbi:hypothetical protein H2198_008221 [Neophaeococcomyces mojaviensis]|uniref:Uncharacterized protein n=1 Tax=Neophaeococcomyces mojaviensis TaxID=3383035 RepID=A0ACC2ZY26_9EURO|nr:hypothetical protein H2198_008221 [Knufia sp. JES_112]